MDTPADSGSFKITSAVAVAVAVSRNVGPVGQSYVAANSSGTGRPPLIAVYDRDKDKYVIAETAVCTARWATANRDHWAGELCGAEATERLGDIDLCSHHYRRALDWFYKTHIPEAPERHEAARREQAERARLAAEERSVIYYLRRQSDGMIKIGVTSNYKTRLSALRREHGELSLLLAYAGSYAEENDAHVKFATARVSGEWFRPALPLLLEVERRRTLARGRDSRLPAQVGMTAISALVKAARAQQKAEAA